MNDLVVFLFIYLFVCFLVYSFLDYAGALK